MLLIIRKRYLLEATIFNHGVHSSLLIRDRLFMDFCCFGKYAQAKRRRIFRYRMIADTSIDLQKRTENHLQNGCQMFVVVRHCQFELQSKICVKFLFYIKFSYKMRQSVYYVQQIACEPGAAIPNRLPFCGLKHVKNSRILRTACKYEEANPTHHIPCNARDSIRIHIKMSMKIHQA